MLNTLILIPQKKTPKLYIYIHDFCSLFFVGMVAGPWTWCWPQPHQHACACSSWFSNQEHSYTNYECPACCTLWQFLFFVLNIDRQREDDEADVETANGDMPGSTLSTSTIMSVVDLEGVTDPKQRQNHSLKNRTRLSIQVFNGHAAGSLVQLLVF